MSVDKSEFTDYLSDLESIREELPEMQRELHEKIAENMAQSINASAPGSGKVAGYQKEKVGSYGGYAKISPDNQSTQPNGQGKRYHYAYVTNSIVYGHKIRKPGNSKRYEPKIRVARVPANNFYSPAASRVEAEAIHIVDEFNEKLAKRLGGEI